MIYFFSFHLVSLSPWPLIMSLSLMFYMMSVLYLFNDYNFNMMLISIILLLLVMFQWWRDIIRESTLQGMHCMNVMMGLRLGMILFILSELMFFVSFFWTFFNMMLSSNIELGMFCPPKMINVFNPYNIPLLNTLILLSSGISITLCHNSLLMNNYNLSLYSMKITLFLGLIFTNFQLLEYYDSYFNFSDSIYGSIFFMATGFHGLHVLIGSIFIMISLIRMKNYQFSVYHHFGFEACSWYWHFVDIIFFN